MKNIPIYPLQHRARSNRWTLAINGEVENSMEISLEKVDSFPTTKLTQDFTCLEGWSIKNVEWEGVSVSRILDLAVLKPSAKGVLFASGKYSYVLGLQSALEKTTILARKKFRKELTDLHDGGPVRLVFKGQNCYESVRSIDTVSAIPELFEGSSKQIATKRLETQTIIE